MESGGFKFTKPQDSNIRCYRAPNAAQASEEAPVKKDRPNNRAEGGLAPCNRPGCGAACCICGP